jgi:NTP pyrophosphatase (non-canonical NTP hydrolase)
MNDLPPLNQVLQPLTFKHFSQQNLARSIKFMGGTLAVWSVSDWGCAAGGEMGEVLDGIKKLRRLEEKIHSNNKAQPEHATEAVIHILKEIGDTATYLDLLAQRMGSDLETCLRAAFNSVSERENLSERI